MVISINNFRDYMRFRGIRSLLTVLIAVTVLVAWSCKGSQKTSRQPSTIDTEAGSAKELESTEIDWDAYRSHLDDVFATRTQDQPDIFKRSVPDNSGNKDIYDGFRIQILSTRDMAQADTVSRHFDTWMDTTAVNYKAQSYVIFKQPYYRVHVGDFNDRDKALEFSRIVKKQFPDAWIIYDRIKPTSTPPDTMQIRLEKKKDTGIEKVDDGDSEM